MGRLPCPGRFRLTSSLAACQTEPEGCHPVLIRHFGAHFGVHIALRGVCTSGKWRGGVGISETSQQRQGHLLERGGRQGLLDGTESGALDAWCDQKTDEMCLAREEPSFLFDTAKNRNPKLPAGRKTTQLPGGCFCFCTPARTGNVGANRLKS